LNDTPELADEVIISVS